MGAPDDRRQSEIDVPTLVVAAIASVIAALVVSKLWRDGTLIATAMTPVIVALVKEYLQRPVERTIEVARAPLRRSSVPGAPEEARLDGVVLEPRPRRRIPWWRVGLITGLVAFAVGAAALTLPELIGGRSVTSGRDTTIFGGGGGASEAPRRVAPQPTATEAPAEETPEPEATATPTPSPSPSPSPTATPPPAATVTPAG